VSCRPLCLALGLILLSAAPVVPAAPAGEEPSAGDASSDLTASLLNERMNLERRVVGLSRFRVSYPQGLSGAVGAMWARQPAAYPCHSVCEFKGPFFEAEPGFGGVQVGAGYAVLMAERGDNEHFLSRTYTGYGVRAVLMRTWDPATLSPPGQTLLGVEGDYSIINVSFSLGVLWHVGAGDPEDTWLVVGGVGWGF